MLWIGGVILLILVISMIDEIQKVFHKKDDDEKDDK